MRKLFPGCAGAWRPIEISLSDISFSRRRWQLLARTTRRGRPHKRDSNWTPALPSRACAPAQRATTRPILPDANASMKGCARLESRKINVDYPKFRGTCSVSLTGRRFQTGVINRQRVAARFSELRPFLGLVQPLFHLSPGHRGALAGHNFQRIKLVFGIHCELHYRAADSSYFMSPDSSCFISHAN